jgi:hypothetical protein
LIIGLSPFHLGFPSTCPLSFLPILLRNFFPTLDETRLLHGPWRKILLSSVKLHFKDANDNLIKTVEANEGDDILSIAHEYDVDLEGELFFFFFRKQIKHSD